MRLEHVYKSDAVDHIATEHVLWTLFPEMDQLALKGFSPCQYLCMLALKDLCVVFGHQRASSSVFNLF